MTHLYKFLTTMAICLTATTAIAASSKPWQLGLPPAASTLAEEINFFHNAILLPLITVITLFVLGLLLYACWRFSAKRNPTPSKRTHNTMLEVLWTAIPVIIIAALFVPSMRILYLSDETGNPEMTLKITGHQWYWNYQYNDHGGFSFDAVMSQKEDLTPQQQKLYKMLTDNVVVLPINTRIRLQITASDVLHSWSISDFGVRVDAVPGRLNEAWVNITKPGTYYGFCSELCGDGHAYMPINIEAVTPKQFKAWTNNAQQKYANSNQNQYSKLAQN